MALPVPLSPTSRTGIFVGAISEITDSRLCIAGHSPLTCPQSSFTITVTDAPFVIDAWTLDSPIVAARQRRRDSTNGCRTRFCTVGAKRNGRWIGLLCRLNTLFAPSPWQFGTQESTILVLPAMQPSTKEKNTFPFSP